MITIRYANLPEGSHAQAVVRGRRTVIYFRPGLTPEQRRLSLRRARQSARMGHGPQLSATGVALAVADDSIRVTLRNVAAAVRGHPLGSLLLAAGVTAAVLCYALLVTVSLRLITPAPYGSHPTHPIHAVGPFGPGSGPGSGVAGRLGGPPAGGPGPGQLGPGVSGGIPSPRVSRGGPTPSVSPDPAPSPSRTSRRPTPSPAPSPHPTTSRGPSPVPSPSPSGLCVLGICL